MLKTGLGCRGLSEWKAASLLNELQLMSKQQPAFLIAPFCVDMGQKYSQRRKICVYLFVYFFFIFVIQPNFNIHFAAMEQAANKPSRSSAGQPSSVGTNCRDATPHN